MQQKLYIIIIYRIRKTDVDTVTNIKIIIKTLQAENRPLHSFLDLYKIVWPRQARIFFYGFLIIEVTTSSQANRIINNNINIRSGIKICKLFAVYPGGADDGVIYAFSPRYAGSLCEGGKLN
jgi:hypothetical protein